MSSRRLIQLIVVVICSVAAAGCPGCDNDKNPTGPSSTPTPTATPAPTPAPVPVPETQRIMLVELGPAVRDPAFPGTARNAVFVRLWGQVRNALTPAAETSESLSGGQAIVTDFNCPDRWRFRVGFHNSTPIEGTDATFLQSVAVCTAVDLEVQAQLAPTNRVVGFDLGSSKTRIVTSGIAADGGHLKGALPAARSTLSAAEARATLKSMALSGQIPEVVYYERLDGDRVVETWERNFVADTINKVR